MSHQYRGAHTNEVQHMILDAKNMSGLQLLKTYNVEVWDDGQVYDLTENLMYSSVIEWANDAVEDDGDDYSDPHKSGYDMDGGDYY